MIYVAYVLGSLFLTNAAPHLVAAQMGRPFQSPFARPSGQGFSSSTLNGLWAWANLLIAYVLLVQIGDFDAHNLGHVAAVAVPAFLGTMFHAYHFGRFNGGNDPIAAQERRDQLP